MSGVETIKNVEFGNTSWSQHPDSRTSLCGAKIIDMPPTSNLLISW